MSPISTCHVQLVPAYIFVIIITYAEIHLLNHPTNLFLYANLLFLILTEGFTCAYSITCTCVYNSVLKGWLVCLTDNRDTAQLLKGWTVGQNRKYNIYKLKQNYTWTICYPIINRRTYTYYILKLMQSLITMKNLQGLNPKEQLTYHNIGNRDPMYEACIPIQHTSRTRSSRAKRKETLRHMNNSLKYGREGRLCNK